VYIDYTGSVAYNYITDNFSTTINKGTGTAYWDTVTPKLAMTSLSTHFPKITYQDLGPFTKLGGGSITQASASATATLWNPTDTVVYYVSADNKASWTTVTSSLTTLSVSGSSIYLRITFTGQGNKDTYINDLTVNFI
jgi:hypothetical protein